MRVVVAGCAGFIGSKVCQLLLQQGHQVVGLDNMNHFYDVRIKHSRLKTIQDVAGSTFQFNLVDIADKAALAQICIDYAGTDSLINLAARAGVRDSMDYPSDHYATNLIGTLNLLDLCREHGIKKFVLASTSGVYGDGPRPYREDQISDRPRTPYAASKKAAEVLCHSYHYLYGIDITVLRYFTVFGPAGRPDMSIFRFIRWTAEGEPLTLYGDGSQERDFTYIGDIAMGTIAALKPLGFEIINLGGNRPVTLNTVIQLLEKLLEKKANLKFYPSHPADLKGNWADISKANRLLGWSPKTSIEKGLARAVEWYRQNRSWVNEVPLP